MDIKQTTGIGQALLSVATPQATRREPPQATAAAAPVEPDNRVRPTAVEAAKTVAIHNAELNRSIEAINRFLKPISGDIQFSTDEDNGKTVVKIVDTQSGTVLRQIPTKEALAIAKELDKLQGLLVRDKV